MRMNVVVVGGVLCSSKSRYVCERLTDDDVAPYAGA